ncbi:hypothetical protein [Streptomyces sp. JJ38]|uniref:hypothetical protein n=1 Tax=Streptomyces sp. JJ38 TaxID=2738128 RepID=UPI001C577DF4|nr:hypothetical protein [Streptomyces sp. JJ38]MBW1595740.1 hypothetical protein [Streptomyces sp. JJ38]
MIAISLILLLAAVVVAALGGAALHAVRGLRREVAGLRRDLATRARRAVPAARTEPVGEEVRAAVADALAAERERELAEARAFWAAQEARDAEGLGGGPPPGLASGLAAGPYDGHSDHIVGAMDAALLDALLDEVATSAGQPVVPRQPDRDSGDRAPAARPGSAEEPGSDNGPAGPGGSAPERVDVEHDTEFAGAEHDRHAEHEQHGMAFSGVEYDAEPVDVEARVEPTAEAAHVEAVHVDVDPAESARADAEAAGRAAARRRHPSNPHHTLSGEPVVPAQAGSPESDPERTLARLAAVAEAGTELADVRPGPLGTLDVYVFADGTTVCLSPGHRETAERLADALRAGKPPVLLGGSGVSGGYALTFGCEDETVYVLADRVIASL